MAGNENIDEDFNQILKEEYSQDGVIINIPSYLVAVFCYSLPTLTLINSANYNDDLLAVLFSGLVSGTGFYAYYRYNHVLRLLLKPNTRPLSRTIRDVRYQEQFELQLPKTEENIYTISDDEEEWENILSKLEQSMEQVEDENSETMNASTLFDRPETPQMAPPEKISWFKRLFRKE